MKCSKTTGWPFKSLKQSSQSSIAPIAVAMGLAVLKAPEAHRPAAIKRVVTLGLKLAARLALEFDVDPVTFVEMAKGMIAQEGGAKVAAALTAAGASNVAYEDPESKALCDAIFDKADMPGGEGEPKA